MRTYKIYLNVYDFTSANKYVSCIGLGGYHTGVQIKYPLFYTASNKEYCYCVISTQQSQSGVIVIDPETADYQFNRKIYLGETRMEPKDFVKILEELSKEWTCGKYNMFNNNCNHFSQEFVKKLLGIKIPRWIFRTTNMLTWMCCCLPTGFVSGKWAIQYLMENQTNQFDDYLTNVK